MADEPDSGPPTEPVDSAVGILAANEGAAQDLVSDNLTAALIAIWAGFTAFWVGDAVAELGRQMAQLVIAAQRSAATITEAHLRLQMQRMGYFPPTTSFVDLPDDLRLGAETADVYQRPVRQIRYLESTGVPLDDAVRQATERLEKIALTDLQLARNVAAQQVMSSLPDDTPIGPVRGYRRVIHPELGNVCGLCIAAADRVYSKRELLPLHPACKCTVIPWIGEQDPGGQLNADDLTLIYASAGGTTDSRALSKTRFEFQQHGELGTVLTPVRTNMKGPAQATQQLSERAARMRIEQLERQIEELRPRAARSQWHRDRLEQLQELLDAA
jgi:hypothetical protein